MLRARGKDEWELTADGYEGPFGGDEIVLELESGNGGTVP